MANPEHLAILKQGVEVWNEWKRMNRNIRPALDRADLRGIKLAKANLSRTNLTETNLTEADLTQADLSKANLISTVLKSTRLDQTVFDDSELGYTVFSNCDLSRALGLDKCQHGVFSSVDMHTLHRSWPLPLSFLRGVGFDDTFIDYLPSLIGQPFQFYSVFISFTEKDDAFAQRLYNDLQGSGVRCWRWKEDARWGRSLIGEIDKAVHLYDKLVVICSEHALKSMPVIREIERALQREDTLYSQGEEPEVLFPIRLDDYIFAEWKHPRKADVVAKTVGDFRGWEDDHTIYQERFERLLQDLKPDGR